MKNQRHINLNSWIRQHAEGRNLERTEVAKSPPQPTRKEVDESRKRGSGEAASATHKEGGRRIKEARRWRSRLRNARGKRATILESEEAAQPLPQRAKKEAALIKIAHDQSGRGRGNFLPSYSSWHPLFSAENEGTSPQRGITSPVFAKQKLERRSLQDVVVESLSLYAPRSCP